MFGKKRRYHESVWASLSEIGLSPSDFPPMNPVDSQIDQAYHSNLHHCETALMLFYSIAPSLKSRSVDEFHAVYTRVQEHEAIWAGRRWIELPLISEWKRMANL